MRKGIAAAAVGVAAVLAAGGGVTAAGYGSYNAGNTVITVQDISDAVTLDPQVAYEFTSVAADHLLYSTLTQFPQGNLTKPIGEVATRWTVSANGQDWTFYLRKGIRFWNGDPLTSADVVYSFERAVDITTSPAGWLVTQTGLTPQNVAQDIRAVGPYEVKMHLPQPFAPGAWLAVLANPVTGIVDAKVVQQHVVKGDYGSHWLYNNSAGSGPYVLQQWQPGQVLSLVANPNYNLGPAPKVKRVVWQEVADTTARLDALVRGDADVAIGLTASQLASLKGNPRIRLLKVPSIAMVYVGMGVKQSKPLGNPYVREAIKYAINYRAIVNDLVQGNGEPLQGIIPKGIFGYTPSLPFSFNLAKARQLLKQGGYPHGFTVTMLVPAGTIGGSVSATSLAEAIASTLGQIGIHVNLRQLQSSELYSEYRAHKAQLVLAEWSMDYPDPQDFAAPFADYTQKSLIWRLQDDDKTLAKIVEQAATMQDTPARQHLYDLLDQKLETGPFAVIFQPDTVIAYSSALSNVSYDDLNGVDYPLMAKK
ncbi:MAG: ABC transporter substrate-binding protein [Candidatus Rokubacteria bacterium]|nr:ABC transporter substrate-binding protein [Candidatus Rokubacteria bacterium]